MVDVAPADRLRVGLAGLHVEDRGIRGHVDEARAAQVVGEVEAGVAVADEARLGADVIGIGSGALAHAEGVAADE